MNPHCSLRRHGFTMIEVLIAVSIIAVLASMAMPVLTIAARAAKQSATRSVLHKTDTAIRLFRAETGTFPWQATYADTALGERPTNDLYRRLGRAPTVEELQRVYADADAAAAQYAYDCSNGTGSPVEGPAVSVHVYRMSDIKPSRGSTGGGDVVWSHSGGVWKPSMPNDGGKRAAAVMLNRMAAERARLEVIAGNPWATGTWIRPTLRPDGTVYQPGRDQRGTRLLTDASIQSAAAPGWSGDYLKGELEARFIHGEAIVDAWRRPLIYVGQVKEGMESTRGFIFSQNIPWIDSDAYGLAKAGRRSLADIDPATGEALADDPPFLEDATQPWRSDRRRYAGPGYEYTFELWSAGADGRFDWMRHHPSNRDNIGQEPYDREIRR